MIQNEILGYPIFSQTIKAILANVAQQQWNLALYHRAVKGSNDYNHGAYRE